MRFLACLPLLLVVALHAQNDCQITNLSATVVGPDPTTCQYFVTLNFNHTSGTNQFTVQGNGIIYGTFPYSTSPLVLGPFTAGTAATTREFVVKDAVFPNCQADVEVSVAGCGEAPACNVQTQLVAEAGECNSDSTYHLFLNFDHSSSAATDSFTVFANGHYFGQYAVSQLPLQIPSFPWNGGAFDEVQVCLDAVGSADPCCGTIEFHVPPCFPYSPCELSQLHVQVGACSTDSTFQVVLDFQVATPAVADSFDLWASGHYLGQFSINQLPLTIPNFPWNGQIFSSIKVCTGNTPGCCREKQLLAPACLPFGPCEISHITALTGACNQDGTYKLKVNFQGTNPGSGFFTLYANTQVLGVFPLTALPLTIPAFPASSNPVGVLKICINNVPGTVACCKSKEFQAPNCVPNDSCGIHALTLQTGECTSDSTYQLKVNFLVTSAASDYFRIFANGQLFGAYTLSQLPLTIPNFPWHGGNHDVIKICLASVAGTSICCETREIETPECLQGACEIYDVEVEPGDCNPAGGYSLVVDFQVQNPGNSLFEVWANNGQYVGIFPLTALPLTIPNFPGSSSPVGYLKVCINDQPTCCKVKEFQAPNCGPNDNCIQSLTVQTGECTSDSTYQVQVSFETPISSASGFQVWVNGHLFDTYTILQLPLTIPNIPWNGGNHDVIKVCLLNFAGTNVCCKTVEYAVPECLQGASCEIHDLVVDPGICNPNHNFYSLLINFDVQAPASDSFEVWANNGQYLGTFPLSALPLTIPNFPGSGNPVDQVKICLDGQPNCCKTKEFEAPNCSGDCQIHELTVQTGECHGDSSYQVTVNFQVTGTGATSFQLWANGHLFGTYTLSQLPLTIPNFPWNGGNNDVIKVCLPATSTPASCCKTIEYGVPDCLQGASCEIYEVVVDPGECHPNNNTYSLVVNFQVQQPGNSSFEVWAGNGQYLGIFPLSSLPLTIPNFPWGGGAVDHIKICINDHPDCCRTKQFEAPACFGSDCEIDDLAVETGDCQGDSTYQVVLNFHVVNPPVNTFSVFTNGELYGSFQLSQLPLVIPHFPWNGGDNDVIKICFGTLGALNCCETLEFAVPECVTEACQIADVHAVATPCLCGQFFALVTFDHESGTPGGFDIVGNGHNYGTFPYNTPQPIILGPLVGDNSTMYEFSVRDHQHPDCHDATLLGEVTCPTLATGTPGDGSTLLLAPNPAGDWLNATALLSGGARMGQSTVQVFHADGRLVLTQSVADGSSFQLQVSALPAGVYRLAVRSDVGNVEGTFSKL